MNPDKIGKFIYKLRKEKSLSQYQLADIIPISRQAVSKWERGKTIPDSSTLIRLSEIFHVTINELLKGEHIKEHNIENLEEITLNIVDENNRKQKEIKKLFLSFTLSIISLIIIFLTYYFINSYRTIKVYRISGESKDYILTEGLFLTTKNKSYLKLGNITPNDNIKNIKVYYKSNNKEIIVIENTDIDKILINTDGYNEIFKNKTELLKNTILEITDINDNTYEIPLVFKRDFTNDEYIYKKQKSKIIEVPNTKKENPYQVIIDQIKENGTIQKEESELVYMEETNQLVFRENNEIKWMILLSKNTPNCYQETQNCEELIKEDINKMR